MYRPSPGLKNKRQHPHRRSVCTIYTDNPFCSRASGWSTLRNYQRIKNRPILSRATPSSASRRLACLRSPTFSMDRAERRVAPPNPCRCAFCIRGSLGSLRSCAHWLVSWVWRRWWIGTESTLPKATLRRGSKKWKARGRGLWPGRNTKTRWDGHGRHRERNWELRFIKETYGDIGNQYEKKPISTFRIGNRSFIMRKLQFVMWFCVHRNIWDG